MCVEIGYANFAYPIFVTFILLLLFYKQKRVKLNKTLQGEEDDR